MEFEFSGQGGRREKLSHEELYVLKEWTVWFMKRYPVVGYLKEEYEEEAKRLKELGD